MSQPPSDRLSLAAHSEQWRERKLITRSDHVSCWTDWESQCSLIDVVVIVENEWSVPYFLAKHLGVNGDTYSFPIHAIFCESSKECQPFLFEESGGVRCRFMWVFMHVIFLFTCNIKPTPTVQTNLFKVLRCACTCNLSPARILRDDATPWASD